MKSYTHSFMCTMLLAVGVPLMAAEFTMNPGDDPLVIRDKIRTARKQGTIKVDEPVTVTLTPGLYTFGKSIKLEEQDSGSEPGPVTWRAAQPGTVRVLGGKFIPRAAFQPITDPAVLARLDPSVRGNVLVADVKPYLVKDPPAWPDHPTGVVPGPWLYHNGQSQTLARWPNVDAPDKGFFGYSNVLESAGYGVDKRLGKPAVIEIPGTRAERWNFAEGVWGTGYFVVDWHCDTLRFASYDKATHGAKAACISTYGVGKGGWPFYKRRFFVQNLLEELDQRGEWYLDRKAKKLYWHPQGASGKDEIALAQAITPYFILAKAKFIRIENLSFEYSHGAQAVRLDDTRDCLVKNCAFLNHGGAAVTLNGARNRMTGCEVRNIGGLAVAISGGNTRALLPANNCVDHCVIDNFAMYQRTHGQGISISGCGNAARDNTITHSPDCALVYGGNEHLIANNEFGYIAQDSGDVGCIYTGHNASYLGTLIFGNYIHDLARTPAESNARNGIYCDDCDWGDDVIGNKFMYAGLAIFFGGGKLHSACNNLVLKSRAGVHVDSRGRGWRATGNASFFWDKNGRAFCRYRHFEAGVDYDKAPWCVTYPSLRAAMDDHPEYPGMNVVTGNVFCACQVPYHYDGGAQLVLGKVSPGNTVLTNAAEFPVNPPQPIQLTDAAENRVTSPDGTTVANFKLDASGHFTWTLSHAGKHILAPSPLGITVEYVDFGHKVVPMQASPVQVESLAGSFTNATHLLPIRGGIGFRNYQTNLTTLAQVKCSCTRLPIKGLVSGQVIAYLDVKVWAGGAAYRWTVPGNGVRRVYGENDAFLPASGKLGEFQLVEWERNKHFTNGYPESFYYRRGPGYGVCFPEYEHGWSHEGEVVSPWRGVLVVGK